MKITTKPVPAINVSRFMRMKPTIDLDPPYQREGDVWKQETKSALIDSILNGFDVPKLYFESLSSRRGGPDGFPYQYAVIDGKQRLGAIISFIENDLALDAEFIFFEDKSVQAGGLKWSDLMEQYPRLAERLLDFNLPIIEVSADTGDLIEEMFQRLNASSSLNAAERRNSLLGPTRDATNTLAEHELLVSRSPIKSARYKYRELAAKFLAIEQQFSDRGHITDTKAQTLYLLFSATRPGRNGATPIISGEDMSTFQANATTVLDRMSRVFEINDRLLASIGTVVVYYLAFRDDRFRAGIDRSILDDFESQRRRAAQMTETDPDYGTPAAARLREYNGLVQSTNDGRALTRRCEILTAFAEHYTASSPLTGLNSIPDGELPIEDDAMEG